MPDHLPPQPPAGAVPDTFHAVLRHQWAPTMPAALRRSRFLAVLYAAHRLADAAGTLCDRRGRPVPTADVAHASATSETTAAVYLAAAVAAGALTAQRPGMLTLSPGAAPDWQAALDALAPLELHRA